VRRNASFFLVPAALAILATGCGSDDSKSGDKATTPAASPTASAPSAAAPPPETTDTAKKPKVKVPSGPAPKKLVVKDLKPGSGQAAKAGDTVTVQYVGVLYANGKQFDASWDRGEPFSFPLGAGQVIPGWDQGVVGMKPGGRRELIIPAELGYGAQGTPDGAIPPNAPLVFVIDLRSIG
jgi:peptidylprolyl isomerase